MMFQNRHYARLKYPTKHILICEDDLNNQKAILGHFTTVFEPQGLVQFSIICGALMAASIIQHCQVDLIILDHDMPNGNGSDLLEWMKKENKTIPVITFSGMDHNNTRMMELGATHRFGKGEVIEGIADDLIRGILGVER